MEDATSPYHAAEQALQAHFGVRARSEQMGRKMIRDHLPEQHRALLSQLPFVVIGSLDRDGFPWASLLHGPPGFASSPDPRHIQVDARPSPDDPLNDALTIGAPIGLLAIQLETRRRNRANGRIDAVGARGFSLAIDQAFGNCPQYITPRTPWPEGSRTASPRTQQERPQLSREAISCIRDSDTCFIASASGRTPDAGDAREGVDVSHRGGPRGFVEVDDLASVTTLTLPDYRGNNAFNTLGNLLAYPRAGLLFPRFDTGDLLLLSCDAEVMLDVPEEHLGDALSQARFRVRRGLYVRGVRPSRDDSSVDAAHVR